jgi:6-phosphogluconate dehydrogenase
MSTLNNVAIIGLATMGKNFAKNFASRGTRTAVFNRSYNKTEELVTENNDNIFGYENLEDCIKSLELPRKIFLLVKAGAGTDETIEHILPFLDKDDILVDCGNSNWKDTIRRQEYLTAKGIEFIGCGISGGSDGALLGPSLMPGGEKKAVDALLPFLKPVAARDFDGGNCVTNVGTACAGHFVKMVHNGIEYSIMQGIAEVYDILRKLGYDQPAILSVFEQLNTGDNKSFLLDITVDILKAKDTAGNPIVSDLTYEYFIKNKGKLGGWLLEKIDYRAGAKGTGKWTVEAAMDLGVAVPNIYAGLNARVMTETNFKVKDYFVKDKEVLSLASKLDINELTNILHQVMAGMYFLSYEQGIELIYAANNEYKWDIDMPEVLRIWQGGCIIRSQMLKTIMGLYSMQEFPKTYHDQTIASIRELQAILIENEVSVSTPVINATQDYILAIESTSLPQNIVQAQRDFFGAHTYKRTDREGVFTGGWKGE